MYSAFRLVPPPPAARAGVFAGGDGGGAGDAADRRVALRFERVAGQLVIIEIAVEIGFARVGERIDLQPPLVEFEARQRVTQHSRRNR